MIYQTAVCMFFAVLGIGAVALIHDNTQVPSIESTGIHLSPWKEHKLTFRKKVISLLPPPYTSCKNKSSRLMAVMVENLYNADYGYDASICYQICQQAYM